MKKALYGLWAVLYCICVGLGFVASPAGLGKILLTATALIFFLPPFWLIFTARKEKDRKTILVLRLISAGVLALSLIFLVLNFLSVYFSAETGLVLHVLLAMFSAPMLCGQYWVISLFLWACLLILSFQKMPD